MGVVALASAMQADAQVLLHVAGSETIGPCVLSASAETLRDQVILEVEPATTCIGNRAPVFSQAQPFEAGAVAAGGQLNIALSATDPESGAVFWSVEDPPGFGYGTVSLSATSGNAITANYSAGLYEGSVRFSVAASDAQGAKAVLDVLVSVGGTNSSGGADCSGIDPGIPGSTKPWKNDFPDWLQTTFVPFEENGSWNNIDIPAGQWRATKTAPIVDGMSGKVVFELNPKRPAQKVVSVSRCPGDFGGPNTLVEPGCVYTSNGTGIMTFPYQTPAAPLGYGPNYGCMLTPGVTYYMNVTHAADKDDVAGSQTCGASVCSFNVDTVEQTRVTKK